MKKVILSTFVLVLIFLSFASIVIAQGAEGMQQDRIPIRAFNGETNQVRGNITDAIQARRQMQEEVKARILSRVQTRLTLEDSENASRARVKLSNGRNAEIKIMPEVASQRALQRLRLKNCNESRNCTIELKEVGEGNKSRAAYEVKARKTFKILGFIKNRHEVSTQIDAETGEEIQTRRPWWAWMARETEQ